MPLAANVEGELKLAELVALLSLGTDLGLGQPMEHAMRQCLIALRLAERLGLDEAKRGVLYYAGLLAWVGCHTDAYEQAKWFGDEIAWKNDGRTNGPQAMLRRLGAGRPLLERIRLAATFLRGGVRDLSDMLTNHYLATDELAERLGLGQDVRDCLVQSFERWDGKGPLKLRQDEILLTSQLVSFADVIAVFHRTHGVEGAIRVATKRSGRQFSPDLVKLFRREAHELLRDVHASSAWEAIISTEPSLATRIEEGTLERALEAIADFSDLKSPWTIGHSRSVAQLVNDAATDFGLPDLEVVAARRAALVHDLGQLGVPNSIWDKPSPLTHIERERVRIHPYLGERMLSYVPTLAPLAAIAILHHERLDGSGYPRQLSGDAISPAGRLLAAADVYQALSQKRPHRPARSQDEAATELRAMVAKGKLDGGAVDSVLRAAGHRVRRKREWPAGLTGREVEVLRLLACGMSNKEIASELAITPKTAGTHVEHIYAKIGACNRARASLFAMKHGLMAD
jgi:HD-GYP domain-containing protein (c-di-GMP phosphodiesterase class II)